jgi:hypothetical protein
LNARGTKRNISALISDYSQNPSDQNNGAFDDYNDITNNKPQEIIPENTHNIASLTSDNMDTNSVAMSTNSRNRFGQ